jgi:hypothetical protein
MVVSWILGGIGNQMFQYAAARALTLDRGDELLLDLRMFDGYGLHQGFELDRVFSGRFDRAAALQIRDLLGWRAGLFAARTLRRPAFAFLRGTRFVVEPHFNHWPGIADRTGDLYMMGYWQSERYFARHARAIRADFRFRTPLEGHNAELAARMRDTNSVSLHVRRGDYISNPRNRRILHVCTRDYYVNAIDYIRQAVADPAVFVFSDDPRWVRDNLADLPGQVIVEHNRGRASFLDLLLMSNCRHHVIANSSFSWWGAWLNPDPDKIVVAPRAWFCNGTDDSDLIPDRWHRI